jgi:hypothetical protein
MNNNITGMVDEAVGGYVSVAATANRALTAADGTTDEARNAMVKITTGVVSAAFNVYAPPTEKTYSVWNSTAYTCTFYVATAKNGTTAAGSGVAIPAGKKVLLYLDGTNAVERLSHVTGDFSVGGTLSGFYAARVVTLANSSPVVIDSSTTDIGILYYTAVAGTLTINAPSGSPIDGQILVLRLRTTNVQTLSWNAIFQWSSDLPTVTQSSGSSKYDYFGFMYNSAASAWQVLAKNAGF